MKKKAQMEGLGIIATTFIAILVGVILFQAIAQEVGKTNTLITLNTTSQAWINSTAFYLTGYRAISDVVIYNATVGDIVPAANYTVANNQIHPTTGELTVSITPVASLPVAAGTWNVTGTAQTLTYVPESGARAVGGLIGIFFALAIVIVALSPTLRSGVLSIMGK